MRFRIRNAFYLRLSATNVIPLYNEQLYLDERHVDWMSERTLNAVVSDLRPLVGPKLEAERYAHYGPGGAANAKRGTVDVHHSDTYQFAYFLRKVEPHNVVVKTRSYALVTKPTQSGNSPAQEPRGAGNGSSTNEVQFTKSAKGTKRPRKGSAQTKLAKKKGKGKVKAIDIIDDSEEDAEESPLSDPEDDMEEVDTNSIAPRRSTRIKKPRTAYREDSDDGRPDEDVEMQAEDEQEVQVKQEVFDPDTALRDGEGPIEEEPNPAPPLPPDFGINEDEEEKKLKPQLQLSFRSLNMHDRCLCVVVEPWPALPQATPTPDDLTASRAVSRAPSVQRMAPPRDPSVLDSRFSLGNREMSVREQTPLFLPDPSGRDRSMTPAPVRFPSEFATLEKIDDTQDPFETGEDFGMLAFSQAINNVSGERMGAAEDDDEEMDSGALYGDADEIRGTI